MSYFVTPMRSKYSLPSFCSSHASEDATRVISIRFPHKSSSTASRLIFLVPRPVTLPSCRSIPYLRRRSFRCCSQSEMKDDRHVQQYQHLSETYKMYHEPNEDQSYRTRILFNKVNRGWTTDARKAKVTEFDVSLRVEQKILMD